MSSLGSYSVLESLIAENSSLGHNWTQSIDSDSRLAELEPKSPGNDSPKMLRQLLTGADHNRVRNSSDLLSQMCHSEPSNSPRSSTSSPIMPKQTAQLMQDLKDLSSSFGIPVQDLVKVVCNTHERPSRPRSETVMNLRKEQNENQESLLAQLVIKSEDYDQPHCKMKASADDNVYQRKQSITHHLWPLTSTIKIEEGTLSQTHFHIYKILIELQKYLSSIHSGITSELILNVVTENTAKLQKLGHQGKLLRFLQRVWPPLFVLHATKTSFQFLFTPIGPSPMDSELGAGMPSLGFAQSLADFIHTGSALGLTPNVFEALFQIVLTQGNCTLRELFDFTLCVLPHLHNAL
ncbi:hypothetical protein Ciccas_008188, partial [Cichlidogyrus casuarinus]